MRRLHFCVLAIACATTYSMAQNIETYTPASVSHWSAGIKGGGNYFRAVPSSRVHPSSNRMHWILGGTVDYFFNPLVGLGVELLNNPYGSGINATSTLDANVLDVVPYFSVNLSNLLAPNRNGFWKKVNLYNESGFGCGFFNYSLNKAPVSYGETVLAKSGFNAEYAISKFFACTLDGQYRYYDKANLGGVKIKKGFCEALNVTVGIRIKLGNKGKPHVRNVSLCDYYPNSASVDGAKSAGIFKNAANGLDSMDQVNIYLRQKLQELQARLNLLAAGNDTLLAVNAALASFQTIEFGFDSSKLSRGSFTVLNKIAELLLSDTYWTSLRIRGNTDSIGPVWYNKSLSVRRADAVKKYLMGKEVPIFKMKTIGEGEEKPIDTNRTQEGRQKNRRVDFQIER